MLAPSVSQIGAQPAESSSHVRDHRRGRAAAHRARHPAAHERRAAASRPGRRGRLLVRRRRPGACGGWRSSTWPAATSRSSTRTARSASSSTARSTTSWSCARSSRPRASLRDAVATPKSSSTPTRSTASTCVERLWGMFALALWDAREQRLLLARDRLGKKPLVYYADPQRRPGVRAPSCRRCWRIPSVPREVDPRAIDDYLTYLYVPAPTTAYRDMRKLPPGHRLVWQAGHVTVEPYWQRPVRREAAHLRGRGRRAVRQPAARRGPAAADRRRAARRVPQRRHGLELGRGRDGRAEHDARQDVLDRLRRARLRRAGATPARSPSGSAPSTTSWSSSRTRSTSCRRWCGTTASRTATRRRSRPTTWPS